MAPKRKTAKAEAEEPPTKEAKTEEPAKELTKEPAKEEPKKEPAAAKEPEDEASKEKEKDDKKDTRARIKETICFHNVDTTLNVVPTTGGRVLMALSDGGMQFLIAGARANVGVKSGRHYYEVKVVEALTLQEGRNTGRGRLPMPRQLVRLGFSLAGSSLVLGDGGDSCVCFDSEGCFFAEKKRIQASARFGRDQIVGVLLNLDQASPNANTVSLFINGKRISEPMPLPEKLRGQPLFPHVAYRNVSLQVNFGPFPAASLPFKCRTLQEAAVADVVEVKAEKPKDGKYEVLFPVAFPDEGTFDWLDDFLEKHPNYVEISDRKIQEWAVKSGVWKPKSNSWKHSNDKPEYNFGLAYMDDLSIRRCIDSITSVVPRNYVFMEVKQNLTEAERRQNLRRFAAPHFKRTAHVVMGEPPASYKEIIHAKLLEEKQSKATLEWKMRKLEKERKKAVALRQKEIAEQKAALEAKKKEEEDVKMKEAGGVAGEKEGEEKAAAEEKGDKEKEKEEEKEAKEGEKKEEAAEEKKEEVDEDEPMPQVELSEEEKKQNFRSPTTADITPHLLNSTFDQFCIPEKEEGFDEVRFEWQNKEKSKAYLKKWVLEKKITSRVEDLTPSESFRTKLVEFQKALQEWKDKHKEFKASKKGEEKRTAPGEEKKEGEEEDEEEEKMDVDIFSVEDVCDVGNGEPLFASFELEDWALLALRFELCSLRAAFAEDVKDPERVGIHENHLLFYYTRYFKKQLVPALFGKETPQEVVELVKDAVKIDADNKVLVSVLKEEPKVLSTFVKLQEENRRKRQQRIDAGDETARLHFSSLQLQDGWRLKGAGKAEASQVATEVPLTTSTPPAPPTGGPRLVPAPRSLSWQGQQEQKGSWQGGKAGGGRWQPTTYAPRIAGGKGGKKA